MKKALCAFVATIIFITGFAQVNVTVGPYLQSPTPSSIKIKWRTDLPSGSKVVYGSAIGNLNQTVEDTSSVLRHTLQLSSLSADTKYYYAIYNGNTLLEGDDADHWFRTFPAQGTTKPVRVWAIGDFGKGNEWQKKVRDAYESYDTTETNLWLWLGDNVYQDGTEAEYLSKVFDSVYGYQKMMKHWAFEPSPGNHDYNSISPVTSPVPPLQHAGPYYDFVDTYKNAEAGGVASGNHLYYSFDYANVHFISLNSELGSVFSGSDDWTGVNPFVNFTTSPMLQWLQQDLQANTKPWTVVYFHQPPYTDGSHDSGAFWEVYMKAMRENFAPIWEQYGVDLVLTGHSHVYERSYLVKGCYCDAGDITPFNFVQNNSGNDDLGEAYIKYTNGSNPNQGTVYVVCGNSGSNDSDPPFNHPFMFSEYGCDTCCGSFVIDVNGDRLDGKHIDAYGVVRDHFTIKKMVNTLVEELKEADFSDIKVSPNPFGRTRSAVVAFEMERDGALNVTLTDVAGKQIEIFAGTKTAGKQEIAVDAAKLNLAKGNYLLTIKSDSGFKRTKMINVE